MLRLFFVALLLLATPALGQAPGVQPKVTGTTTNVVARAAPATLLWARVTADATALFMIVINATALPANGALAAGTGTGQWQDCIYIPGYGTGSISFPQSTPEKFTTGIVVAASSTGCNTLTAATPLSISAGVQ